MNYSNPQNSDTFPESVLINQKIIPYLYELGYKYTDTNVKVSKGITVAIADLVAYLDPDKTQPYLVVEVKLHLLPEITLLDPPVQKVFSYAAYLGTSVRYLLVTDGTRFHWFERSSEGHSLLLLDEAPRALRQQHLVVFSNSLLPATDPQQFLDLMHSVMQVLAREGTGYGLRMGSEINRILIAKLRDEQIVEAGGESLFRSESENRITGGH